jgi:hypothetical protein
LNYSKIGERGRISVVMGLTKKKPQIEKELLHTGAEEQPQLLWNRIKGKKVISRCKRKNHDIMTWSNETF